MNTKRFYLVQLLIALMGIITIIKIHLRPSSCTWCRRMRNSKRIIFLPIKCVVYLFLCNWCNRLAFLYLIIDGCIFLINIQGICYIWGFCNLGTWYLSCVTLQHYSFLIFLFLIVFFSFSFMRFRDHLWVLINHMKLLKRIWP